MGDWKQTERETLLAAGVSASTALLLVAWGSMWNDGNFDRLEEWVAADFRFNEVLLGLDGIRAMVARQRSAFEDFHIVTREAFAVDDRTILRLHWTGTHTGDYQSLIGLVTATGRSFAIDGIEIYRTAEGRIVEGWAAWNLIPMFQTFGAIPTPNRDAKI